MATATHYAVNPTTGERLALIGGAWVSATNAKTGVAGGAAKLTEGQAKDGFNAKRMLGAGRAIDALEGAGYDAGAAQLASGSALTAGYVNLPVGHVRAYEAAQNEWTDSLLRQTTGAAMTKEELEHAKKTYFPQVGDNADIREQKAAARRRVEQDAITRAGPGAAGVAAPKSPIPGAKLGEDGYWYAEDPNNKGSFPRVTRDQIKAGGAQSPEKSSAAAPPVRVGTPEEALKLPAGTRFITPDGRLKVR